MAEQHGPDYERAQEAAAQKHITDGAAQLFQAFEEVTAAQQPDRDGVFRLDNPIGGGRVAEVHQHFPGPTESRLSARGLLRALHLKRGGATHSLPDSYSINFYDAATRAEKTVVVYRQDGEQPTYIAVSQITASDRLHFTSLEGEEAQKTIKQAEALLMGEVPVEDETENLETPELITGKEAEELLSIFPPILNELKKELADIAGSGHELVVKPRHIANVAAKYRVETVNISSTKDNDDKLHAHIHFESGDMHILLESTITNESLSHPHVAHYIVDHETESLLPYAISQDERHALYAALATQLHPINIKMDEAA